MSKALGIFQTTQYFRYFIYNIFLRIICALFFFFSYRWIKICTVLYMWRSKLERGIVERNDTKNRKKSSGMAKEGAESDERCEVINFTGEIRDATTTFDLFSQVSLDNAPINWIPIPISRETLLLVYRCLDEISMEYLRDALRIFTNRDFYACFGIFHAFIPSFEFFDLKQCRILTMSQSTIRILYECHFQTFA